MQELLARQLPSLLSHFYLLGMLNLQIPAHHNMYIVLKTYRQLLLYLLASYVVLKAMHNSIVNRNALMSSALTMAQVPCLPSRWLKFYVSLKIIFQQLMDVLHIRMQVSLKILVQYVNFMKVVQYYKCMYCTYLVQHKKFINCRTPFNLYRPYMTNFRYS